MTESVKNEEVMRSKLHQLTKHFLLIFGLPPGCEPENNKQYSARSPTRQENLYQLNNSAPSAQPGPLEISQRISKCE
ncbi:hypothetical protein [Herbaspirillum rhizosphaerae]|uniref:hypothetical protein n=1 Tax=Herbaspirillum rhizosphaerae TaxID=346179 RepID=UPI0012EDC363|nr:hypothetical protein [Herbaspirillum rhizosphaerae]